MSVDLSVEIADGIATLTMNRPQARNALSAEMRQGFAAAVPALASDASVRAVILTGSGGCFCAGGDLRAMESMRASMTAERWRARMREVQPWISALIELDKPLIAAVDGPAYGAGFSLALMADFVIATPRARFCLSFMRVGLVPDFAAMYTLPRVVGVQRARELMLSAREVDAQEALRLGLVMELHEPAALLERARALAHSFTGASPLAVSLVKQGTRAALVSDLRTVLAAEADHQALCYVTEAHQDAVRRFLAKEPAAFRFPAPGRDG